MSQTYTVSASPHLHDRATTSYVMWQVVIALIPALMVGIYFFGWKALGLTVYGGLAAVITEAIIQKWRKRPISVSDGSAFLTGILVAYNIHAASPWWMPVVGAVFAIAIGKHAFGGLGCNPMNPALLGRAFLVLSWPTLTTAGWIPTKLGSINGLPHELGVTIANASPKAYNLLTSATPLKVAQTLRDTTFVNSLTPNLQESQNIAHNIFNQLSDPYTLQNLFWGNIGGCLGEVSAAALLLGAAWLIYNNIIEWRIPVSYIGTVLVLTFIIGGIQGPFSASLLLPVFHIFSGGLMLGAFFMATDYVTSPMTRKGRVIFGIGAGIILVTIRLIGGYPEGVCYSILLMNLFVPLIDRYTVPKPFGRVQA